MVSNTIIKSDPKYPIWTCTEQTLFRKTNYSYNTVIINGIIANKFMVNMKWRKPEEGKTCVLRLFNVKEKEKSTPCILLILQTLVLNKASRISFIH